MCTSHTFPWRRERTVPRSHLQCAPVGDASLTKAHQGWRHPPPAPVRFGAPCCWGCRIAYTSLSSVGRGVAPRIHSPSIPWRLTFGIKEALAFRLPTGLRCATGLWGRGWRGIERRERRSWGTSVPFAAFAASLPQGPRLPPGPTEPLLWVPGATPPRPPFGLRGGKGPHWAKGASPALTAHSSVNRC